MAKFSSLHLVVAPGFKGGSDLADGGLPPKGALTLDVALVMTTASSSNVQQTHSRSRAQWN